MSDRFDPAKRPRPVNYKIDNTYTPGGWPAVAALWCLTCDVVVYSDVSGTTDTDVACAEATMDRHNAVEHPELLYVFTSAGWLPVSVLLHELVTRE